MLLQAERAGMIFGRCGTSSDLDIGLAPSFAKVATQELIRRFGSGFQTDDLRGRRALLP